MNCEDIAMNLFVSNMTDGHMALAVDDWGFKCRAPMALSTGHQGIEAESNDMHRSKCLDWFATDLQIKYKWKNGCARLRRVATSKFNTSEVSLQAIVNNPRFQSLDQKRSNEREDIKRRW